MKNKRISLITLLMLGAVVISAGCASGNKSSTSTVATLGSSTESLIPIKFGADSSTFSVSFQVAKEKGFFKQHGIDPEVNTFSYGIDTLNAALTGQVDVGIAMDFATLSRFSSGDLKIISFVQQGKAENTKVVAVEGVNSTEDIKGKTIGVQKGTVSEYIVTKYLDKLNIKQDEVKKEGFGSNAEIMAAFAKGDVKVAFFSGVVLDKALQVKGAKVIGSQGDIPFAARGFIVIRDKVLKEKPDVAKNILLALNDAEKWIKANPEDAAQIEANALKAPKEGVLRELKDQDNDIRLSTEDVKQLKEVYDYATKNNLIKGGFNLQDKIATDPLKQALPDKLTYKPEDIK